MFSGKLREAARKVLSPRLLCDMIFLSNQRKQGGGEPMEESIALFGAFGTSVLQPGAVIGLAITVVLFILEVRWSRAHPPRNRRAEKAKALGYAVTARRVKY